MKRSVVRVLAAFAACAGLPALAAEESFDLSAYEKKAFEWSGFLELRPERQSLRREATGYLLQYPGESRDTARRLGAAAELSGVLRRDSLSFNFTGHASWIDEPRGTDDDARLYEAYAGWQIDARSNVELGKRVQRWGKGYAWSPVAFLERPKDATDPELAREGFVMATASFVRSFDAPLQTLALTAALVPTGTSLNADYGAAGHANPALKLYGLFHDTDIDLIVAGRGSRGPRVGLDFSRNLGSNLELHGEWAHIGDAPRAVLTTAHTLALQSSGTTSALLGLRYLTERDTTVIFELYRNGAGYTLDEFDAFHALVRASAADPALTPAARAAASAYNRPGVAQRYAYLRVSQKEPFDILDFTPSLSLIVNTADHSYTLIPEAAYTGVRNLELRFRLALNRGNVSTEYGEKPVRSRLELRARCFF